MKLFLPKTVLFTVVVFFLTIINAVGQTTYFWRSEATTGSWNTAANWWNGSTTQTPQGSDIIEINNNVQTSMTNNLSGGSTVNRFKITFGSNATTARTIGGTTSNTFFDFGGTWPWFRNDSSSNHLISFPFTLGTGGTWNLEFRAEAGPLSFTNTIGTGTTGKGIMVYGNDVAVDANRYISFSGIISGNGFLNISRRGVARLNVAHTYTGQTQIDNGELWSETTGNTISNGSSIFVGNGGQLGNVAKFFLSRTAGGSLFTRSMTINPGNASTRFIGGLNTSGTNEFSGAITNNASELNLEVVNSGGVLRISNVISGTGSVVKIGPGTAEFSGTTKTYTGSTRINAGILSLVSANQIADASNMILAGGTFRSGATTGNSETVGTLQLLSNSTIALGTGNHTLTFANSSAVGWTGGTSLTITGWAGIPGSTGGGTAGKIQVGVGGLSTGQLAQINFTGFANGAVLTATGEVVPSDYVKYYSKATGDASLLTSWSTLRNGLGTEPTTFTTSGSAFIIQNGHVMTTLSAWSALVGLLQIEDGGELMSTNNITVSTSTVFQVDNGGKYVHNNTGNWATTTFAGTEVLANNSTVEVLRINNSSIPSNSTYGNLIFDLTADPGGAVNFAGNLVTVNGNFIVKNTQTRQIRLGSNTSGTVTVNGNFELQTSSDFAITSGTGNRTLQVNGSISLTGGILNLSTSTGAGYLEGRGDITIGSGVTFAGNVSGASGIYLNATGNQNVTVAQALATGSHRDRFYYNTTNVTGINETYNGTVAQSTVSGTGATPLAGYAAWPTTGTVLKNFTVNNSAGVTLRNDRNVNETLFMTSGDLTGTGIVSYASGATLHYNGTAAKTSTDVEFPSLNGPSNLIIGNPAGVTLHATKTLTGNLTVNNSGIFDLGANTIDRNTSGGSLTLGSSTALTIGGTNSFPANYDTHSVNATSTVEYNGANQTIAVLNSSQAYGNLVISGNGIKSFGGNVVATNLTNGINAVTTVAANQNVTVNDVLTNNGTFTVANNANLIQVNDTNNVGAITVNRNSSALMRLDYTLWSSPVASQNLLSFSPLTMANRFYVYNPSNNQYAAVTPSSTNFAEGTGYLIRMPDNHPTSPTTWSGSFVGVPHNGDVTITVTNNTYNAVGNPYPSTIDADDFINDNNLTEALYFWRKTNAAAGSAYATYTLAGGAGTGGSGSSSQIPNGIIQVGQGFIARSTSTALVFNNQMRVADNNNQFFRSANNVTKSRIWLNLNQQNNILGQTMVAYMEGTTTDLDAKFDGKYINDSQTAITSVINNEEYAVQARGEFAATDVVPITIKLETAGNYTISLAQVDGVFSTEHDIFVRDNELGVEHDIRTAPYSFSAPAGVLTNRFELVYQSTLSVENPTFNNVVVFSKNKALEINAGNETISSVTVFDIRGRKVAAQEEVNTSAASIDLSGVANQVLIVQIKTSNGQLITKKVVH